MFEQGGFSINSAIDGLSDGDMNGWAYYGRLADARAMFLFDHVSLLRRIVIISGASREDHHITRFSLAFSTDPIPSLDEHEAWLPLEEMSVGESQIFLCMVASAAHRGGHQGLESGSSFFLFILDVLRYAHAVHVVLCVASDVSLL